jgi:ribosomal protein S18 acetylase RimI-like enzyme
MSEPADSPSSSHLVVFEPIGARHLSTIQPLYLELHAELQRLCPNPFDAFSDKPGNASHLNRILRQTRQQLMLDERYVGFLASLHDLPIAYIAGSVEALPSIFHLSYHGSITELFVSPPFRNHGIGSKLLSLILDAFQAQGLPLADIHSPPDLPLLPSLSWLQKRGFSPLSLRLSRPLPP